MVGYWVWILALTWFVACVLFRTGQSVRRPGVKDEHLRRGLTGIWEHLLDEDRAWVRHAYALVGLEWREGCGPRCLGGLHYRDDCKNLPQPTRKIPPPPRGPGAGSIRVPAPASLNQALDRLHETTLASYAVPPTIMACHHCHRRAAEGHHSLCQDKPRTERTMAEEMIFE